MQITPREARWLNFYRASELHGGLILGQLAQRVRDPLLIERLTRHSVEEVQHAELWAETIISVGARLVPVRRTYQAVYAEVIGVPASVFQVLALTQVFERRVYRHFLEHERRTGTHARIRQTLRRMIEEERDHLGWVRAWLDAAALSRGAAAVQHVLDAYAAADEIVYRRLIQELDYVPEPRERRSERLAS